MKAFLIIATAFVLVSCATSHTYKDLDQPQLVDTQGQLPNGTVGFDKKDRVVVREESRAIDDLRVAQNVNQSLSDDYRHEHFMWNKCRTDLSDTRLGGSGELPDLQDPAELKDLVQVREEMGIVETDDGARDLRVTKTSFFDEQVKAEKRYTESLRKMISVVKKNRTKCEYDMAQCRRDAGLPGTRYNAEGYFTTGGTWVEQRKGENSLDDAFEIQAGTKAKSQRTKRSH